MIGKITIGKSFNGCIKYCLNDKLSEQNQERVMVNRAEVLTVQSMLRKRAGIDTAI